MNHAQLVMRRRQVRARINDDPAKVSFVRAQPSVKNPNTGGYIAQPAVELDPQTVTIIQNVSRYTDGLVNSEAGDIPDSEYRLLGLHTLDIRVNDEFQWLGEWYKVTGINMRRIESVYAAIELRGPENRG